MPETYRRAIHVSRRQVGETTYLIDGQRNAIHQLNPIGAAIWDQLVDPKRPEDLVETLHAVFDDVSLKVIERDVQKLIDRLLIAELIARAP